ncbi:MAG: hypothetical protein U0324_22480 [Polyangiales bacterium]
MNDTLRARWEARAKARGATDPNPLYALPAWVAAHTRLLALLPNAAEAIPNPARMAPDPIVSAARAAGAVLDTIPIDNPWRANPTGRGTKPWESYSAHELFDAMFEAHPVSPGPLWFIPDECFGRQEPYVVTGEQLREAFAQCRASLHLDMLFIWAESPRISIVHHVGCFVHITFPASGCDPAGHAP